MIVYKPDEFLADAAPEFLVKRLVNKDLSLNRAVLTLLSKSGVVTKKALEKLALKVMKSYRERFTQEKASGATKAEAFKEATNDKKLMVQRVQDTMVSEVADTIRLGYLGERYIWLPSSSLIPRALHQLKYGKRFTIGVGEMPGDEFGCKCGMKILVKDTELNLEGD